MIAKVGNTLLQLRINSIMTPLPHGPIHIGFDLSACLFGVESGLRMRAIQSALVWVLMVACAAEMFFLASLGIADLRAVQVWGAVAVSGCTVFFVLVRSGFSNRWASPAMSLPQMLWAIACNATGFVLAGHIRGGTLGVLTLILSMGIFGITMRQVVHVCVLACIAFGGAIVVAYLRPHPQEPDLVFLVYAIMVLILLAGSSFVTWRLEFMRAFTRQQQEQLGLALLKIQHTATRDELTDTVNRRHMLTLIRKEIERSGRTGEPLVLAMLDIDHFKRVNDTLGHPAGDLALKCFADTAQASLRTTDTLARWGGEEFVVMLPATPAALAHICLERIRTQVMAEKLIYQGHDIALTVSIGAAIHHESETLEQTLSRADSALYAAKSGGRNRLVMANAPPAGQVSAASLGELAQDARQAFVMDKDVT